MAAEDQVSDAAAKLLNVTADNLDQAFQVIHKMVEAHRQQAVDMALAVVRIDSRVIPDLVRRTCGGWLAVAPNGALVSVAVTAATQDEAIEKFLSMYSRWLEILDTYETKEAPAKTAPHASD